MSVKIQINSLEALERLVGNDNELEVQVRGSVVQEFAKKHLRAVATTELVQRAENSIRSLIKNEFFEEVKKSNWDTQTVFKKELMEKIREDLNIQARLELMKLVKEVVEESKTRELIQERVDTAAAYITADLADTVLNNKLDRLVEARMKEKLGLR